MNNMAINCDLEETEIIILRKVMLYGQKATQLMITMLRKVIVKTMHVLAISNFSLRAKVNSIHTTLKVSLVLYSR